MMFPLAGELAATGAAVRVPVAVTCRVLGFSRQAYCQWLADPVSDRDLDDAYLTNAALAVHAIDPEFGYRLIADELAAAGHQAGQNRVHRLCSQQGITAVHTRKRGTGRGTGPPVHDDLVNRDFTASAINEKWLTDITEHPTAWIPVVVATPAGSGVDGGAEVQPGAGSTGRSCIRCSGASTSTWCAG